MGYVGYSNSFQYNNMCPSAMFRNSGLKTWEYTYIILTKIYIKIIISQIKTRYTA